MQLEHGHECGRDGKKNLWKRQRDLWKETESLSQGAAHPTLNSCSSGLSILTGDIISHRQDTVEMLAPIHTEWKRNQRWITTRVTISGQAARPLTQEPVGFKLASLANRKYTGSLISSNVCQRVPATRQGVSTKQKAPWNRRGAEI